MSVAMDSSDVLAGKSLKFLLCVSLTQFRARLQQFLTVLYTSLAMGANLHLVEWCRTCSVLWIVQQIVDNDTRVGNAPAVIAYQLSVSLHR